MEPVTDSKGNEYPWIKIDCNCGEDACWKIDIPAGPKMRTGCGVG